MGRQRPRLSKAEAAMGRQRPRQSKVEAIKGWGCPRPRLLRGLGWGDQVDSGWHRFHYHPPAPNKEIFPMIRSSFLWPQFWNEPLFTSFHSFTVNRHYLPIRWICITTDLSDLNLSMLKISIRTSKFLMWLTYLGELYKQKSNKASLRRNIFGDCQWAFCFKGLW